MSRDHRDALADMVAALDAVAAFIEGHEEASFAADMKTQFAVMRALEVLGEASKLVPDHVRAEAPAIPWRAVAGMRDKLIHAYFNVDVAIVWATATVDLPAILPDLRMLLEGEG